VSFDKTFIDLVMILIVYSAKGPLPQDVLDALDLAWNKVGVNCPKYWR
jgi:hypothetical protein